MSKYRIYMYVDGGFYVDLRLFDLDTEGYYEVTGNNRSPHYITYDGGERVPYGESGERDGDRL